MKFILTQLIFLTFFLSYSQNQKEINSIIKENNTINLSKIKKTAEYTFFKEKKEAIDFVKIKGLPINYTKDGNYYSVRKMINGQPLYYKTYNLNAAKSTRADFLHNSGGLGLNIEGQGMTAFVWDAGHALLNHQEFVINGSSKLTPADTNSETDPMGLNHATHVMGTITAQGINNLAKGMAPQANGYVLDWNNDIAEVISGTGIGMLLSNHSYGPNLSNLADWTIGAYTSESNVWDDIMFNAPYYLTVCAAGNDGTDIFSNASPLDGNPNYDKLYGQSTAKNVLVVANANDAYVNSNGEITASGNINNSSSQGPTDDYRIKPDITGNGTHVFSPIHSSTSSYDSYTGTSMASPNVCGSLLLLQQLYNQENGTFMKSSSLKGLALHTADDRGPIGPDAIYGWGYMNTKKAAEIILNENFLILEKTLNNNETYTFEVTVDGSEDLIASLSWIDPAGIINNSGTANLNTPALVNDLDIRITKNGTTYFPWKLTNATTNTKGDNLVDPYEKIEVSNITAGDIYIISISHKGILENNLQNFSIIVSGISSSTAGVDSTNISDFKLFPNPSTDGFVTFALNNIDKYRIEIFDILGKKVYFEDNLKGGGFHTIKISNLKSGIYYTKVSTQSSKTIKKLIIK